MIEVNKERDINCLPVSYITNKYTPGGIFVELMKRNIHMDCLKCKASTQITLEDDINISDSRPDAYKLIMDRGNVVIEEVKVTDDHVNVKGCLVFKILYLTEEEKADVAGMEGRVPFEELLYVEGIENGDQVNVEWDIEDLTVGLINSRKFSVQSLIMLNVFCEEIHDEETAVDLVSSDPVEFRKKTLDIAAMTICKKDIFRIKEEVEMPGSFPNIFSLIWWDITPANVEFKMLSEKIGIQGEIKAFFIYRGEGEDEICHYETTLPFSGTIDCPGAEEGMISEIRYHAEVKEAVVRPDFDGEERVITFEMCLNLDINAYEEEQLSILSDVYGVVKEISVQEREASFKKLLGKSSGKLKLSEHFAPEGQVQIVKVLHAAGKVQIVDTALAENGIEVTGTVNLQVLYESAGDEKYGMLKENIPFQYVLEAEGVTKDCIYRMQVNAEQLTVSVINGNEIDVKCVLLFSSNIYRKWKEKIVEKVTASELDAQKMSELPGIAVYMVRDGESLWDIGKRYYVPVSTLMQTNQLACEEVKAGDRILIVKSS